MKCITHDTFDSTVRSPGGGESCVEVAGYIDGNQQIANLVMAGASLETFRKGAYDYDHSDQDDGYTVDPTRCGGFDFSDAYQLGRATAERLKVQREEADAREAERVASIAKAEKDKLRAEIVAELAKKDKPA